MKNFLRKYFKDPTNKKNWLFVLVSKNSTGVNRTEIYDLEANVNIVIEPNRIDAFFETSSLGQASGILIDGFDEEDVIPSIGRKKREVSNDDANACKLECHSRKRRWTGPVLEDGDSRSSSTEEINDLSWHSHVLHHIIASGECTRECSRR